MMDEILEIVRREAQQATAGRQMKTALAVTAYNPKTYAIKGILLPHETESGWIPIGATHAGDGYGIMAGPNVGTADKLDGDIFEIEFANGDPNTPIARMKGFSAADNPPEVKSGETLVKHQTGGSSHFQADGSIVTTHKDGMQSKFDKDGNHTLDTKGKDAATTGANVSTAAAGVVATKAGKKIDQEAGKILLNCA